ncbi:MAG: molecular chaperone DnaJ [Armatimonadota bacterium]|nr:molecular chaperone DnaJ [Armatimonadota bacterium]
MASQDFYEILGVDRRASQEEIKQAFRRLAREMHPDVRRDDPQAEERFKAINEAYQVLSDPVKRSQYDRFGRVGMETGPVGGGFGPFEDLFDMFFGGRVQPARAERDAPVRGSDLRYDLEISLEEVARGTERRLTIPRLETCPTCFGTGAERGSSPQECPACRGTGEARVTSRTVFGVMTQIGPCPDCGGTGTYIARPCKKCRGSGRAQVEREVTVTIPAGVEDGMQLRLPGEGEAGVRGGGRGDLYVVVHVKPHPTFVRRGRDLYADLEIGMVQAALGGQVRLQLFDGDEAVTIPPGTQPGETITVRGRGLPDLHGGRGHLHLKVRVVVPRTLTAEQRALLEEFARAGDDGRRPPHEKGIRRKPVIKRVKDLLQ